jgi:cyclopropane fatty-acyl-phospholipid synthase-like methyltransferase
MLDLAEGEYCVDGVVSFGAMLHIPRGRYPALLNTFASFMSRGGVILVALKTAYSGRSEEDQHRATLLRDQNGVDNTDSIEHAGFSIVLHQITGPNGAKREIILARS